MIRGATALVALALFGALAVAPAEATAASSEHRDTLVPTGDGSWRGTEVYALATTARDLASACGTTSEALVDVPPSHPHHAGISCLYLWEVAAGTAPGRYSPALAVTRAQMATFLARVLSQAGQPLPDSPPRAFGDVAPGSTHARATDQLAALGVVAGDAGRFNPNATVTRAQMASFLMRTAAVVAGSALPQGGDAFGDDTGNTHEPNINRAAEAGIATGTSPTAFTPSGTVTRAQMGSFLARLLALFVDDYGVPSRVEAPDPAEDPDPIEGPLYRFIIAPGEFGNGQPARWDPCAAPSIPWRIVGSSEPAWDDLVTDAFADAVAATGLQAPRDQGFTGSRRIDVEFQPASELPTDVLGIATFEIALTPAGEPEFLRGHISFNADFLAVVTDPDAGPLAAEAARILTLHEVGHIFGLGHVDDARLLMATHLDPDQQDPVFGPGELDGLARVGASRGCIPR